MNANQDMSKEEYIRAQNTLTLVGNMVEHFDWAAFRGHISRTHALAPVLDPTLYRRGHRRLECLDEMAEAAGALTLAFRKLKHFVEQETAASQADRLEACPTQPETRNPEPGTRA